MKYSKEFLETVITKCNSKADLCRELGIKPVGGNYKRIDNYITIYNLDVSHFKKEPWNKGKNYISSYNKDIESILIENSTYTSTNSLKKRLIKEGYKLHKCELCGYEESVELHHINGNPCDNRLENLQMLCPNCHAKTNNFRGKGRTHKDPKELIITEEQALERHIQKTIKRRLPEELRKTRSIIPTIICPICGKKFKPKGKAKYCSLECYNEAKMVINTIKPGAIQLLLDFKELKNFLQVGKKYNVSDNAIRKWCKLYGFPIKTKEMKELVSKIEIKI